MADIFLSASVTVLFDRLASVELLHLARQVGIDAQLKQCKKTLYKIQAVLADAEEKQLTSRAVKLWLADLQDFSYDLDDILDDLETEILRRKVMAHSQAASISQVSELFSSFTSTFNPMTILFNYDVGSKINDISTRLQEIFQEKDDLDLKENVGGIQSYTTWKRWPSTSLVEPHVYGREKDKESVLRMLLRDEETDGDGIVVPILGMGGVGKTTLAQLVYNDEIVDTHFELKGWACVSDNFDLLGVTKSILESLTSQPCNLNALDTLQVTLKEKLSGNKFLLVLDDIWNQNYEDWDLLRRPFLVGAPGSKIIVTTRIADVAKMMNRAQEHHLKQLGDEHCLSLLARHALGREDFDEHLVLKEIGEKIVNKCQGLPLAVKTLGGLLRTKQHQNQWEDVLNSKIWELPEQPGGILPALRLSYHHLLPHLKQCFAFCAIYPKDYEFDKNKLVKLWMAVGLLPRSKGTKQSEDFGWEYFDDLLSRSFFQQSSTYESKFVMHDLLNDLAVFVAGERCFRLEDKLECTDISERVRYSAYITQRFDVFQKFRIFYKFKCLRTFLRLDIHYRHTTHLSNKVLKDLVPQLKCLRLLSLSSNTITELPTSVGDLNHLRYLDFSWTLIKTLPESVSSLYNLQTLLVRGCKYLRKLPVGIGNLINLRHLDNAETRELQEMPHGIGKLTSLQTLSKIVVGKSCGLELSELRDLVLLRGKLSIIELQNVIDIRDAQKANLRCKQGLDVLILEWSTKFDESRDAKLETDVLGFLQPHKNLEKLAIHYYGGIKLPSWIGDPSFTKLLEINLIGCERCTSLPPLGKLHFLKVLCIQGMLELRSIGFELYRDEHSSDFPFSSLECLTFDRMPKWEEWFCFGQFTRLRELTLRECPKLIRIPQLQLPSLCILRLENCHGVVLKGFSNLTSLTTLTIDSVKELSCLSMEFIQFWVALEYLEVKKCNGLVNLWGEWVTLDGLVCLKEMKIESCRRLVSLCKVEQALPCNLEILSIVKCDVLERIPSGSSLIKLFIEKCPKLLSFAAGTSLPPMLQHLDIKDCEALDCLPDCETSISSLEELKVSKCSSLRWWPMDKSPTTLKKLSIGKVCRNLESGIELQRLNRRMQSLSELDICHNRGIMGKIVKSQQHNLAGLVKLLISNCKDVESFREKGMPPIPNLRVLFISSCKNLKYIPLDQIQGLESLRIWYCPNLESFPDGDLPPKLTFLSMRACGELLKPLPEWGLNRLTSLQRLSISGGFPELVSISDSNDQPLLPPTLKEFSIGEFQNLESLSKGLQNFTSLEHLILWGCPKLRSLPKENLVRSLLSLEIKDCPILETRCLPKDKGHYWPVIADIPRVKIAHRYIHHEDHDLCEKYG